MGCFNDVCRISGLPIAYTDEVVVYHIIENGRADNCYPWSNYSLIGLPYIGKYNDYGGYEDIDLKQKNLIYTLDLYRKYAAKLEVGENKYHDIPVDPATLDHESMHEAIWEGRLFVKTHGMKPSELHKGAYKMFEDHVPVMYFPILKEVHDKVMEKGEAWINDYRRDSFNKINIENVQKLMDFEKEEYKHDDLEQFKRRMECHTLKEDIKRAASIEFGPLYTFMFFEDMCNALGAEDMVTMLKQFRYLMEYMHVMNITMNPGRTSGQDTQYEEHAEMHKFIAKLAMIKNKRYD